MINKIENISMHAFPSFKTEVHNGWIIRSTSGCPAKRNNSVIPLEYLDEKDLIKSIEHCESVFRADDQLAVFKLTVDSKPYNLDSVLENRAYKSKDETIVMTLEQLNTDIATPDFDYHIEIDTELSDTWLENYRAFKGQSDEFKQTIKEVYMQIPAKTLYLSVYEGAKNIGIGQAVIDDGYVGIFDIGVDAQYRNKGLGKAIVQRLLNESMNSNFKLSYLQVVADNEAAINAYKKLGYKEIYRYWYRVKS